MARIRTIKPEFPQSESMGRVSRDARGHFKKKAIPAHIKREVAKRYGCGPGDTIVAYCAYCGANGYIKWFVQPTDRGAGWVSFSGLELDHIEAELKGGDASPDNIALACAPCNRSKSYKSIEQWKGRVAA